MSSGINRTMQVRVASRLRAQLSADAATGLPLVHGLSETDQRELCEVGGGRMAALSLSLPPGAVASEVVARIAQAVRRTDLLGLLDPGLLLLLVPGLEPSGGESLVARLRALVAALEVEIGVAYRSGASVAGWTPEALAAEAARNTRRLTDLASA